MFQLTSELFMCDGVLGMFHARCALFSHLGYVVWQCLSFGQFVRAACIWKLMNMRNGKTRPRHRRLETFTTESKIIPLIHRSVEFLADRTNGRAYGTVLRPSSSSSVCLSVTLDIVAKRCVLEQKLLWRAYRKSYMRNRLVPK